MTTTSTVTVPLKARKRQELCELRIRHAGRGQWPFLGGRDNAIRWPVPGNLVQHDARLRQESDPRWTPCARAGLPRSRSSASCKCMKRGSGCCTLSTARHRRCSRSVAGRRSTAVWGEATEGNHSIRHWLNASGRSRPGAYSCPHLMTRRGSVDLDGAKHRGVDEAVIGIQAWGREGRAESAART